MIRQLSISVLGTLILTTNAAAQEAAPPVQQEPSPPAATEAPTPPAAVQAETTEDTAPPAAPAQTAAPAQPSPQNDAALEAEFAAALGNGKPEENAPADAAPAQPARTPATLSLLDLSFDLLAAGGGSSVSEHDQRALEGGGHDPKNRGFTIQNVELTFAGVVDPYVRGDANIVMQIDENGESTIELEEAYLTTLDLPANLQLKAGQFFAAFGRLNPTHPHTWDFVDQPVVNSRLLGGDGFRNPGVQLSWLTPLPFFAELVGSVQDAHGETAGSFRNAPGEVVAGRTLIERPVKGPQDLAYLARLRTSFDLSDEVELVPGVSALFGPNASAADARTEIYGADLYLKWKPLDNDQGWPFLAWQSEGIYRRYEAGAVLDDDTEVEPRTTLGDWGVYSQLTYGFARPWVAAARFDYARGERDAFDVGDETYSSASDPLRDERQRYSGALAYYPSEFSKIRLQYNFDHAQFLPKHRAHSVYLQAEILFGAHGAHKF